MLGYQIVLNTEIKHNPVAVLYGDAEFWTAFLGRNESPWNLTDSIQKEPISTVKTPSFSLATGSYPVKQSQVTQSHRSLFGTEIIALQMEKGRALKKRNSAWLHENMTCKP